MAQIRIYSDGTFESVAAAKDPKAELVALKADLKTIIKVEGLRVKREAAKKAGDKVKDKDLLAQIKELKKTLSSPRNSTTDIIHAKIGKLKDEITAPKLTRSNKTGDPRRNPTRLKTVRSKKEPTPETREQRFVKTMRKMLTGGHSFTDSTGKKFKGMTALDINEELRYDKEFSKARTSVQLQMLLRKEGLNVQVRDGKREGRGKSLKVWTV